MHGLLLLLTPFFVVMAAIAAVGCARKLAEEALSAAAAFAAVALGVTTLVGWSEDSDPPRAGDSQWTAHPGSHAWFVVLAGLMLLVVLAKVLSREHAAFSWLAPPALLVAAPACFGLFTSLSH